MLRWRGSAFAEPLQLLAALPGCALRGRVVAGEHLRFPMPLASTWPADSAIPRSFIWAMSLGQQRPRLVEAPEVGQDGALPISSCRLIGSALRFRVIQPPQRLAGEGSAPGRWHAAAIARMLVSNHRSPACLACCIARVNAANAAPFRHADEVDRSRPRPPGRPGRLRRRPARWLAAPPRPGRAARASSPVGIDARPARSRPPAVPSARRRGHPRRRTRRRSGRARDRIIEPAGLRRVPGSGSAAARRFISCGGSSASARSSRFTAAPVSPRSSARRPAASRWAAASGGQPPGLVIGRAQLAPVAERLLQVVAGDLVQLHQAGAAFLQPPGEPLVQLEPGPPWPAPHRRRRGSADAGTGTRPRPARTARSGRTRSLWTSVISRPGTSGSSGAITCTVP